MPDLTKKELERVLNALGRRGDSVYHARKRGKKVHIQFVGDREETVTTLPRATRTRKSNMTPVPVEPIVTAEVTG